MRRIPHLTKRVRDRFSEAGGDPADAESLIDWAHEIRDRLDTDPQARRTGAIVARDGQILAQTERTDGRRAPRAYYVSSVTHDTDRGLIGLVADFAAVDLKRAHGQDTIHVSFW